MRLDTARRRAALCGTSSEERARALEGDLAALDGRERDDVPDGDHEGRQARGGLADARVVEAHEPAAARRVARVLALPVLAVPVLVPAPGPPPAVAVVVVVAPGLQHLTDSAGGGGRRRRRRLVELLLPRQAPAPHPRPRDEIPHAARLVGQVELRAAEHLPRGAAACCNEDEQEENKRRHVHGDRVFFRAAEDASFLVLWPVGF